MKRLLSLVLVSMLVAPAFADIQDPPANDHGPTRKLGRGLANIAFGITELSVRPNMINERHGNSAAWSYGVVQGFGRFFARIGYGIYDVTTFPFASTRSSYRPPYKSNIPWIHGGMEEFPPELGWETRYRYTRAVYAYP
jgi:putative exosortase-associated protein (TIGR04073 family)